MGKEGNNVQLSMNNDQLIREKCRDENLGIRGRKNKKNTGSNG
jgi:hypothetical protein